MPRPIIDTHCDLLTYLIRENASIYNQKDIGCAVPHLKTGNVKLQVMAIFTPSQSLSHNMALKESELFKGLREDQNEFYAVDRDNLDQVVSSEQIGMLAAIENASGLCDEELSLKDGFKNLETIINNVGRLFYIGLTHHTENRFGGGNYSAAGLKKDGKALLDYLDKKRIAVDFSHTSDALAYGILDHITKQGLDIPIIASHSNYRPIYDHPRNLPDEIAKEIIRRKGLIGLNFVRAFVHPDQPNTLLEHLAHGIELGATDNVCFGADYFYHQDHPDKSRIPFYHTAHEDASYYPDINQSVQAQFGEEVCDKLSYKNVLRFLKGLWG
ncbi:MAG: membrane dipeptidase [Bacteroidota bacterium]